MTEHIKTGDKIISEINNASNENKETRWVELSEKQWVSLSLLTDYIRIRKKLLTKGKDAWTELHIIEKLLKEGKIHE